MIIDNQWQKFYVPDEIGNDQTLTVADVFNSAIVYSLYLLQEELKNKQEELLGLDVTNDYLLSWAKANCPDIQQKGLVESEIQTLQDNITNYGNN